jgi:hypothetical protein
VRVPGVYLFPHPSTALNCVPHLGRPTQTFRLVGLCYASVVSRHCQAQVNIDWARRFTVSTFCGLQSFMWGGVLSHAHSCCTRFVLGAQHDTALPQQVIMCLRRGAGNTPADIRPRPAFVVSRTSIHIGSMMHPPICNVSSFALSFQILSSDLQDRGASYRSYCR